MFNVQRLSKIFLDDVRDRKSLMCLAIKWKSEASIVNITPLSLSLSDKQISDSRGISNIWFLFHLCRELMILGLFLLFVVVSFHNIFNLTYLFINLDEHRIVFALGYRNSVFSKNKIVRLTDGRMSSWMFEWWRFSFYIIYVVWTNEQ